MECFASFLTKKTGEKEIGRKVWFFSFEGKGKVSMGGSGIGKSGGTHLILSTTSSVNTQSFAI